jgi:ubiquinone/menaquinone biosynthesis C-methylase UbiE
MRKRNVQITDEIVREENRQVYAAEAKTYDVLHPEVWNWYEQKRYHRLVKDTLAILNKKNPVIVDVGAGTGNLTLKYLSAGCRLISIDISKQMLSELEKKLRNDQEDRVQLICCDIETALGEISEFDGICFSSVLHHIYDYKDVIRTALKKLNPGGFFFNIHDPLIQEPKSRIVFRIHRLLGIVDERLYRLNAKRKGYNIDTFPDDSIAEFHQTKGTFKHKDLMEFLVQQGLSIEHFETYTSRRYGFFGWLATEIIGSENSFALIGRKS